MSNVYIFDTLPEIRFDITGAYLDTGLNLDDSGFIAGVPKEEIEDGAYKIGIYIKKGDMEALQYIMTDNVIVKAGNSADLLGRM